MGCVSSKGISAKEYVAGQELLGARQMTKVYNEQPLSYGPESVESVFLRALGVADEKQISVRFEEKSKSEQEGILMYLYINWHHLQQDSSVIKALMETSFVTSADKRSRDLYKKPKDLFDPGDPLLASIFCGEVQKFPGKRFASDGWLKILRKTGLRNTDDANTMLECATRVEFLGAKSMKHVRISVIDDIKKDLLNTRNRVSLKNWSLAETLIKAIFGKNSLLHDQNFCNKFGKIVCIPAEKGFPLESGKKGVKRVFCSYSEAILLQDWKLAWSAAPIVTLVPPEYSWGALQLRSPPAFTLVLMHLRVVNIYSRLVSCKIFQVYVDQLMRRLFLRYSSI